MSAPLKPPSRGENVLDGLSESMKGAMVMTNFNADRAARIERTSLMDVALRGGRALRTRRGGKK